MTDEEPVRQPEYSKALYVKPAADVGSPAKEIANKLAKELQADPWESVATYRIWRELVSPDNMRVLLSALEDAERERDELRKSIESHLKWFERFICNEDELNSSTPRKVAQNAQDAAAELRAFIASMKGGDAKEDGR